MARLFGTDGVRGVAVTELTCELAMNIGRALTAKLLQDRKSEPPASGGHASTGTVPKGGHASTGTVPVHVLVGKDTRRSSDILEAALIAGITSAGGNARVLGVVPTPAVAFLVRKYGADAGVMITASHNSAEFNGIKIFNRDGFKFPDELEDGIEALALNPDRIPLKNGGDVGTIARVDSAIDDYKAELRGLVSVKQGTPLKILFDCANGSASAAVSVLADCIDGSAVIHNTPDGMNINDKCGSTYIENLKSRIVAEGFDLGIAFDGDADRMLAVDSEGSLIDGDKIIALLAVHMKEKGELKDDTVVVTVMSNLGFHQYMREHGLKTAVVGVGDRYVLEKMLEGGYGIGGEQSGHIIFRNHATTGDGILSAVKFINMICEKGKSPRELAAEIPTFPQTLKNVTISADKKGTWEQNPAITKAIEEIKEIAGAESRILIRESGTEPLLRVMIEGREQSEIESWADKICAVAKKELV